MNRSDARKISQSKEFTRQELFDMLKTALETNTESYWKRPSPNKTFDMGFYFNLCVEWVGLTEENKDEIASHITAYRVLHKFGEFSPRYPFGIEAKKRVVRKNPMHSEKPTLTPKKKFKDEKKS